jgi:hypothetical protein
MRPQPFRRFRVFRGLRSTGFLVVWGLPFRPLLQTTVFVVLLSASGPPADGPIQTWIMNFHYFWPTSSLKCVLGIDFVLFLKDREAFSRVFLTFSNRFICRLWESTTPLALLIFTSAQGVRFSSHVCAQNARFFCSLRFSMVLGSFLSCFSSANAVFFQRAKTSTFSLLMPLFGRHLTDSLRISSCFPRVLKPLVL